MLIGLAVALAAVGTALITLRGLLPALKTGLLTSATGLSDYAVCLAEFHDNLRAGNLAPVWAAHLQNGFGEPHLQFRAPLQLYVTEVFYLITAKPFLSLNLTALFFVSLASLGMGLLLAALLSSLKTERRAWASAVGALGYGLSPYLLRLVFVNGALSELAGLAVLPFAALALLRVAQRATSTRIGVAGLACALLVLAQPGTGALALAFFAGTALLYRKQLAGPWRFALAIALGLACTSYYWAAAFGELALTKAALLAVDDQSYAAQFTRLDHLTLGLLALAGLLATLWCLSVTDAPRHPTRAQHKALLTLMSAAAVAVYFSHRLSTFWYEAVPLLPLLAPPASWQTFFVACGTVLAALVLALELEQPRHWTAIALMLASFGTVFAHARALEQKPPAYWAARRPVTTPSSAGVLPVAPAEEFLKFKHGRGEFNCDRRGPTRIECEVLAISNATLDVALLDYPGWQATVDGVATGLSRDPVRGTPSFTVSPGKHAVELRLRNTPLRLGTKLLSSAAFLALLALLFQNQFAEGKAMLPKRAKRLEA